ncbi:MAG TPA: endonuclease MutS2, partial [Ignavibacteria bacterium]|nr:endonuclease MutS2 [Ignavibacteria bacterium]
GDEQSIEDDISTFSSHLSNIKNILSKADSNSLVLIDEIGTGTDPSEGTALAAASLIKLNEANSTVFATTHHGKLKLIVYQIDGFENAAMEFDTKNLQPTYKFKQGIPGSSYALEVAKRIGLSDDFLSLAAKYLEPDKNRVENFLIDLETKSKELKNKLDKIEIENTRLKGLSSLYQQNIDKLNSEKKEIIKKVKTEANEYLNSINKKFENLVRDLKESNAGTEIIKSSKKVIKDLKKVNDNILKEDIDLIKENHSFTIGNIVAIKNTATIGEIIVILEGKRKAVLRVGSIKMLAKMDDLIPAKMKEPEHESKSYNINLIDKQIRIDIRGEKPEIAEFEVIKFVDNAYSAGMNKVEILHGKGTGVLKKTVKEILEKHEKVKRFYFAPIEFGGEGITIVEIE